MTPPSQNDPLQTLVVTINSLRALLHTFSIALHDSLPSSPANLPASPPNPLALLSSTSKVLKAQTTKLTLLVITKPFTPSEINHVLTSLSTSCLPALVAAVELLRPEKYTLFLQKAVRSRVKEVLREFEHLVEEIPVDERGVERIGGRDTLANTGVLWEGCDGLVQVAESGLKETIVESIEGWKGLFGDAIEELEEWRDGEEDKDMEGVVDLAGGLDLRDTYKTEEAPGMGSLSNTETDSFEMPAAATKEIQPLIARTLQTLNLIRLLYPAVIKRRVRRFPNITITTNADDYPTANQVKKIDKLVSFCELFSNEADEVAGSLYQLDEDEVIKRLTYMEQSARECIKVVSETWDGGQDEFSLWVEKWLLKLEEI